MLSRTTALAGLAAAALLTAGGQAATTMIVRTSAGSGLATAGTHTSAPADHAAHEKAVGHADADDATKAAAADAAAELPPCPADVKNHGAYVSSVAKAAHEAGADHGALVSAAAQSDCGKKVHDGTEGDDGAGEDADEGAKSGTAKPSTHGKSGEAHGKAGAHPTGKPSTTR